ncbi:MAG: GNAT family N-acetyltransferase [Tenericutes bacterium GWC2_34_14]|nr:MAG: GNAT family N-acetyltransferase [Tenericutes bacterium GWA2_35_7]OHE28306.1 MAG: GNAT family N-acetyltransferase [Tenericutes bacterium GWC2_34_14]OHE33067.1 MAG: GNAT family N-acetyltransferase [Tenericutes bacterium GWE2_34_108]OHE36187.1 MAG: GNAT family N-acetyltransferase [Tenericutes bacterium GWF1_35_14]OHE38770.1 MAG: GNAT family N-acetyltransferase [Tenericutes bacterium GWF2_35_184]OHE42628.1 MAG: GNAT family N-acetyltransferase [Tenericutes bacterium RIFOXYA12_FULL_35_10]OH
MIVYQTEDKHFQIRQTTKNDIDLIYSFIYKLAVYEKLEHIMTATKVSLEHSLFDLKQAEVVIAEVDQKPIGFALFFHNYSTFLGKANLYLEDLFIDNEYRHQGYGKLMFKYLAKLAVERSCERFDWMCLNWNEPSIKFYQSLGAKPMSDWITFRLEGEALKSLSVIK